MEAGLSPREALAAGTTEAARLLGAADRGALRAAMRPDFLLLDANPLLDVANIRRKSGVMLNGRHLTKAQLAAMLGRLEASF